MLTGKNGPLSVGNCSATVISGSQPTSSPSWRLHPLVSVPCAHARSSCWLRHRWRDRKQSYPRDGPAKSSATKPSLTDCGPSGNDWPTNVASRPTSFSAMQPYARWRADIRGQRKRSRKSLESGSANFRNSAPPLRRRSPHTSKLIRVSNSRREIDAEPSFPSARRSGCIPHRADTSVRPSGLTSTCRSSA